MDLKEFVRDTLIQLTEGVKEAQGRCFEMGGLINPMLSMPISNEAEFRVGDKYYPTTNVRFTVGLTESNSVAKGGGIGVLLPKLSVGVGAEKEKGNETVTSVKFNVTVVFPYIGRDGEHSPLSGLGFYGV